MGELGIAAIALAAAGAAPQQVDAPVPPADRSRPAPDVYYPPLPPAPVQEVATSASLPKSGGRTTQS